MTLTEPASNLRSEVRNADAWQNNGADGSVGRLDDSVRLEGSPSLENIVSENEWRGDEEENGTETSSAPIDGSERKQTIGTKKISLYGSWILNFNTITGPAIVIFPLMFQEAGWFLPLLGLFTMWLLASLSATMLCESMQRIPGNRGFAKRYEYCTLVRHYFGDRAFYLAQVGFNAGLISTNVVGMIVATNVMETMVHRVFGTTFGISYNSFPPKFLESLGMEEKGCYWGESRPNVCNTSVVSLGFFLTMSICIPLGYLNLEDNIRLQYVSMMAQFIFSFEFASQFIANITPGTKFYCPGNGPERLPMFGRKFTEVLGICIFAYAFVSTIPSWVNEKKEGVSVKRAIWIPTTVGTFINVMLGLLGAMSYKLIDENTGIPYEGTDNVVNLLAGHADPLTTCNPELVSPLTQLSVDLWGMLGYIPGIPILAIIVKYNLYSGGICNKSGAFFFGVCVPWIITAFFYQADVLAQFCNWVAIICQGFVNLVVPSLLYIAALRRYPLPDEIAYGMGAKESLSFSEEASLYDSSVRTEMAKFQDSVTKLEESEDGLHKEVPISDSIYAPKCDRPEGRKETGFVEMSKYEGGGGVEEINTKNDEIVREERPPSKVSENTRSSVENGVARVRKKRGEEEKNVGGEEVGEGRGAYSAESEGDVSQEEKIPYPLGGALEGRVTNYALLHDSQDDLSSLLEPHVSAIPDWVAACVCPCFFASKNRGRTAKMVLVGFIAVLLTTAVVSGIVISVLTKL